MFIYRLQFPLEIPFSIIRTFSRKLNVVIVDIHNGFITSYTMEAASSISDMELLHRFLVYGRDDGMYFAGYNSSITDIHKYSQSLDRYKFVY